MFLLLVGAGPSTENVHTGSGFLEGYLGTCDGHLLLSLSHGVFLVLQKAKAFLRKHSLRRHFGLEVTWT